MWEVLVVQGLGFLCLWDLGFGVAGFRFRVWGFGVLETCG